MTVKKQVKSDDSQFAILRAAHSGINGWALLLAAVLALFLAGNFVTASTVGDDPYEILAKVKQNQMGQHRVLDGQLRHGETVIPFRLTMDEGEITYQFFNPDEALVLHLDDKSAKFEEITKKGAERVATKAQYDRSIRGTEISYEDLAMRFLYWPVAKIAGEEIMLGRNCWKLRVEPGSEKNSQYGYVMLWIEKQSGGLAQVETYDKSGNLVKRFMVHSVQHTEGGGYILKQMRIQKMENGKPVDSTPTYLEIKKPAEGD